MNFASSRSVTKLSDFDKPSTPLTEAALKEETEGSHRPSRGFGDKANRKSGGPSEPDSRFSENWAAARERKQAAVEEKGEGGERNGRYGRREREQDGERRNGYGERQDTRWQRDERRQHGEKQGGWRERERERRDRDWGRGQDGGRDPEWMDEPAPKQDDDLGALMGMPKNQEEFERWKKEQHARNKMSVEEPLEALQVASPPPEAAKEALPAKTVAPLKLEGIVDKPFGSTRGGDGKTSDSGSTPAKSAGAKTKTSRFMPMFKKADEPKEEQAAPQPASAAPNGTAEDKAGFDRILQMLGNTGMGSKAATSNEPASPPPRQVSNGQKPKSRFTGFFDQTPKSPERIQSPEGPTFNPLQVDSVAGRSMVEEPGGMFGGRLNERAFGENGLHGQPPPSAMSPEQGQQRPQSGRINDLFLEQPPSRGASTPELQIQNLLAAKPAQRQQSAMDNKNSQFLLDLLQTKGSRPSSSQASQRRDDHFQLWRDQPPNLPEPHAPKPRAPPPPGLFEDQLLRNHPLPDMMRQEPQASDMPQRRTSQRAPPPGFFSEQQLFQQHHQRNFTEPARQFPPQQQQQPPLPQQQQQGRRMSTNPNQHPHMPMQHQQPPPPPFPAEFLQSTSAAAPPPGFNPMPRHPPGIHNIPNIFSAPPPPPPPQQQQQPLPPPPQQQQGGFPGCPPPPGFYGAGPVPPGFMGMRSPVEAQGMQVGANGRRFEGFAGGPPQGR